MDHHDAAALRQLMDMLPHPIQCVKNMREAVSDFIGQLAAATGDPAINETKPPETDE